MADEGNSRKLSVVTDDTWDELLGDRAPLTPKERELRREQDELDRLRDYLARPRWRSGEAKWILAGIDPEETVGGPGDWGLSWLPDGLGENWLIGDDRFALEQHVQMELEDVGSFISGDARSPAEWIALAQAKKYTPPWLGAALRDPTCHASLKELALRDESPSQKARARGGQAKAMRSAAGRARRGVVRAWDEWLSGEKSYEGLQGFIEEMEQMYFYARPSAEESMPYVTGRRTIRTWVNDLERSKMRPAKAWIISDRLENMKELQSA